MNLTKLNPENLQKNTLICSFKLWIQQPEHDAFDVRAKWMSNTGVHIIFRDLKQSNDRETDEYLNFHSNCLIFEHKLSSQK